MKRKSLTLKRALVELLTAAMILQPFSVSAATLAEDVVAEEIVAEDVTAEEAVDGGAVSLTKSQDIGSDKVKLTFAGGAAAGDTAYFTATGNTNSKAAAKSMTFDGVTYDNTATHNTLKMESATSVSFTTTKKSTLYIVADTDANIKVDDAKKGIANGILSVDMEAGTHTITKGDSMSVFAIVVVPEGASADVPTPTPTPTPIDTKDAFVTDNAFSAAGTMEKEYSFADGKIKFTAAVVNATGAVKSKVDADKSPIDIVGEEFTRSVNLQATMVDSEANTGAFFTVTTAEESQIAIYWKSSGSSDGGRALGIRTEEGQAVEGCADAPEQFGTNSKGESAAVGIYTAYKVPAGTYKVGAVSGGAKIYKIAILSKDAPVPTATAKPTATATQGSKPTATATATQAPAGGHAQDYTAIYTALNGKLGDLSQASDTAEVGFYDSKGAFKGYNIAKVDYSFDSYYDMSQTTAIGKNGLRLNKDTSVVSFTTASDITSAVLKFTAVCGSDNTDRYVVVGTEVEKVADPAELTKAVKYEQVAKTAKDVTVNLEAGKTYYIYTITNEEYIKNISVTENGGSAPTATATATATATQGAGATATATATQGAGATATATQGAGATPTATQTPASDLTPAAAAAKGLGSTLDTVTLKAPVKGKTMLVSENSISANVITVAKGAKLQLTGDVKSFISADKKTVAVNPKGVVSAKKATAGVVISYKNNGAAKTLKVIVVEPSIVKAQSVSGNNIANLPVKKLKVTAGISQHFVIAVKVPVNGTFAVTDKKGVVSQVKTSYSSDNAEDVQLFIEGNTTKKGSATFTYTVDGKAFKIKLAAK